MNALRRSSSDIQSAFFFFFFFFFFVSKKNLHDLLVLVKERSLGRLSWIWVKKEEK